MRLRAVRPPALWAIVAVACLLLTGCAGLSRAGEQASAGSLADRADLHGQTYVVGGKDFDEQNLLCEITVAALESAGAGVTDRCNTGGTDVTRRALVTGDINIYWEYTGTAWASIFGQTQRLDSEQLYRAVADRDATQNGIVWLDRAGFDNSYAFTVAGPKAAGLRLRTLSDMAGYLRSGQPGTVCVEGEYNSREDGLRGLQSAYGFTIPPDRIQVLDQGLVYQSTADGVCTFGEVSTTDGRIPGLGLTVLDDDKQYHVVYNAAPTIRKDAFDRAPQIAGVLDPISAALDYPTMLALNKRVSADGVPARDVARQWLADRGFVGAS